MYLQKYRRRLKIVERIIEVKAQQTDNEVEIWRWLLALLNLYGAKGMSLDETDVEGMETVYRVKILVWRRNIDKYLNCIDNERKLPHQALFSRSGSKPTKRIRSEDGPVSMRDAVPGLPTELYNAKWLEDTDERYRRLTLCVSREQFKWMNIRIQSRGGPGGG